MIVQILYKLAAGSHVVMYYERAIRITVFHCFQIINASFEQIVSTNDRSSSMLYPTKLGGMTHSSINRSGCCNKFVIYQRVL